MTHQSNDNFQSVAKNQNNPTSSPIIMAVFISVGNVKALQQQEPKFRHSLLAKINKEDENVILYFFTYTDVDLINNRIIGTYYDKENNNWKQKSFPLPHVLYDRGGGWLPHQVIISDYIRDNLEKMVALKKINSVYYYDKLEFNEKMKQQNLLKAYLPETQILNSDEELKEMFEKSKTLYVKDSMGSNGRGVLKVEKDKEDNYKYSFYDSYEKKLFQGTTTSTSELFQTIRTFVPDKKMIVQAAIDVITIGDSMVDLRATLQRNKSGILEIMGYPVRLGASKSPITSTQSGAKTIPFDIFFEEYMNYKKYEIESLKERVDTFLLDVFTSVEKIYGRHGEIGIDFAVDKSNKIWLIECNAKPGHDTLYKAHKSDKELINRVFRNPIEYAKFL